MAKNEILPKIQIQHCNIENLQVPMYNYEIALSERNTNKAIEIMNSYDITTFKNNRGETILHLAIYYNNNYIAVDLIDIGANINATDNNGRSPLYYAIDNFNVDIVRELLINGARKDIVDNNGESIMDLISRKKREYGNDKRINEILNYF